MKEFSFYLGASKNLINLKQFKCASISRLFFILFLIIIIGFPQNSQGQILNKLKNKVEQKVKSEAEKRINNAGDKDKKEGDEQISNQEQSNNSPKSIQAIIASKYDFVPGEKIIFFDDFSDGIIGDFPTQWNTTGSGEIVTTNLADGRWFHITNDNGITTLDSPLTLPDNYTIEFDVIPYGNPNNSNNSNFDFYLLSTTKPNDLNYGVARPGDAAINFKFDYYNYYSTYCRDEGSVGLDGHIEEPKLKKDTKYRISIWVQKERIRLYLDEDKLFDLPKAMFKNYKYNMIRFDSGMPLISNIRIATGLPDMRNKLISEGKLISYGIYFDVNKDVVKPESYSTIKEIAKVLTENPTVNIKIVGHTDSDGDDTSNLNLSKRRAEAVKEALIKNFNIDALRIQTDGKGETEPVSLNDNAINKAKNRRVEFIKI